MRNPYESVLKNVGEDLPVLGKAIAGTVTSGAKMLIPKLGNKQKSKPNSGISPIERIKSYSNNQRQQLKQIDELTK